MQPTTRENQSRQEETGVAACRYQGARSRREARSVIVLLLGGVVVAPNIAQANSVERIAVATGIAVAAFVICDFVFARRMGVTIQPQGLVLHYAFYRKRIAWSRIVGFDWRRWRDPRSEVLWLRTNDGRRTRRIPTVARIPRGWWARYFGSPNLRARTGEEVDAMRTLEGARAAAQGSND
jgi:hypothetical protein